MGKLKKVSKKLADQDMFGHTIRLNFDRQGDTQNTLVGGVFSVVIRLAMAVYVFLNLKKMILMERNSNSSIRDLWEVNNETYWYKDMDLVLFYVARKQVERGMLWLDRPDLEKYLDIYYEQQYWDWYKAADDGRTIRKRIKAR